MKQASVGWVRIVLTFLLLGPPIGGVTFATMIDFVLPAPGPLGFYHNGTFEQDLEHYLGNYVMALLFSYVVTPVALASGFILGIARLFVMRSSHDAFAAAFAGLMVGVGLAWLDWHDGPLSYPYRNSIDWIVTCVVAASCCGWISRRRSGSAVVTTDPR